ncbi:MAG: hypothetical protein ACRD9R_20650 [Pyrinomonadaceae bacterium]
MNNETTMERLRFWGRHRCPRCRMPLRAEELACPVCELQIVFVNEQGEVMLHMVALADPEDWRSEEVNEYHTALAVEESGDMYLPRRHLPTRPQRADVVPQQDGTLGIRFHNLILPEDIKRV